jgi:hypothetical protein
MGEKCDNLLSMSNSFDVLNITIVHFLTEVEQFHGMCNCDFSLVNAQNITFPEFTINQTIETLGVESTLPTVYTPRPGMPFLATTQFAQIHHMQGRCYIHLRPAPLCGMFGSKLAFWPSLTPFLFAIGSWNAVLNDTVL